MNTKVKDIKNYFKNILQDVQAIYNEAGFEPFKKPAIVSLLLIFISYFLYNNSKSSLIEKRERYDWLNLMKANYNEYAAAKNTLRRYSNNIPSLKNKDDFLNYTLNSIASKNGISFSSVESQKEMQYNKIVYVTKQVKFTTTFENLIKFIAEIESNDVFIEITQINIRKKENPHQIGLLDVEMTVATIFVEI